MATEVTAAGERTGMTGEAVGLRELGPAELEGVEGGFMEGIYAHIMATVFINTLICGGS